MTYHELDGYKCTDVIDIIILLNLIHLQHKLNYYSYLCIRYNNIYQSDYIIFYIIISKHVCEK